MARFLVLLFALVVAGTAMWVGSMMLSPGAPVLGPASALFGDPGRPVDPGDASTQVFTVEPGSTAATIGEELKQRDLIRSALIFRVLAQQQGVGGSLAAGDYELSRSMSTLEVLEVLAEGRVKRGVVATIPEGWRVEQIADKLEAVGFTSRDEFMQAVADPPSVPAVDQLPAVPAGLEGYLFPETYEVRERVSGRQAAELMVRMFVRRVGDPLRNRPPDASLTAHQVLTLASIVEREAQVPEERPTIASVFLNRLAMGMPLQADPTVQYAVAGQDLRAAAAYGYWKRQLTPADLQAASSYNTYARTGLPPGPICNPGRASIEAVLRPATTDYLYFVATGDGSHLFARTLAEHNANVARASR